MYDICDGSENVTVHFENESDAAVLQNFTYVRCNIPGPGFDISLLEEELLGCNCQSVSCDLSQDSACTCIKQFGAAYTKDGRLFRDDSEERYAKPVLECSRSCTCSRQCSNRIIQNGLKYKFQVYRDPNKGFCLRCLEPIERDCFVCEYAGELLTEEESRKRVKGQGKGDMNYVFVLQEHCQSGVVKTYVDPSRQGNIGRFLNHSCEPNLYMVPVRMDTAVPHLCLFAGRDIAAGEELVYDYSGVSFNLQQGPMSVASETDVGEAYAKKCYCGSTYCRGYLPFDCSVL